MRSKRHDASAERAKATLRCVRGLGFVGEPLSFGSRKPVRRPASTDGCGGAIRTEFRQFVHPIPQ